MAEPLTDPDCRDGKHRSCVGGPCECSCHALPEDLVTMQDRINEAKARMP